ncbi:chemotaxis protein [Oceanobacillus chungangensis]|uniref:Chemotaxis protein n=1 Tax=Oceanobacillus chungangensis TaxID=1229152 RepID=A0A3D8PIV9_9BACI|nr:chemotaxis protein [Oceanobacillus chungangensis]RDW15582.1 chemotaxis protein [Oceanobacillus chungangensis]
MTQKIAIAILHGMGTPKEDFADDIIKRISKRFSRKLSCENAENELVFESVFWSSIFESKQLELWKKMQESAQLDFPRLRRFIIEFLGDAIAYQPTMFGNQNYDKVHAYVASAINRLRKKVGSDAPLCVISHSLGTIVASNYFYDLQFKRKNRGAETRRRMNQTPIEQGETLTLFYTLGSPMVLWSLRYTDFGIPIIIPSPRVSEFYPNVVGEWLNFYDKDDIFAYPLKGMNEAYNLAVTKDIAVNAGGIFTSWSPLSHRDYDKDNEVIDPIVNGLVRTWRSING